jgi:hypothetical protein
VLAAAEPLTSRNGPNRPNGLSGISAFCGGLGIRIGAIWSMSERRNETDIYEVTANGSSPGGAL